MQDVSVAELFGMAQALAAAGQPEQAVALYRDWLAAHATAPLRAAVWFNLGVVLAAAGDPPGAAAAFGEAIQADPAFLPPYVNLGVLHEQSGAPDQALALWGTVIARLAAVDGNAVTYKATALKQTARVLEERKQLAAAEDTLRQVLELGGAPNDVAQHWLALRQRQCRWPLLESVGRYGRDAILRLAAPLTLANHTDDPWLLLAGAARACREDVPMPEAVRGAADFRGHAVPRQRRLRVGYLSSDLRGHAIGHLTAGMFALHDRGAFEVFAYYTGIPHDDPIKQRIRDGVEHWVDLGASDDAAAYQRIVADRIDILVDVNGHSRGARLGVLARRAAPVLVNWLGFPGSMGSPYHHYIVADATIIPPDAERHYSEQVLRLPCYQPNDRSRLADPPPSRQAVGLPADGIVFCAFNGNQKITQTVFGDWMQILRSVSGSVLWLLNGADEVDTRLRAQAAAAGIAPERLVFAPMLGNAAHLARYALADLFLDTAPYGAHTTAADALWMGVPVLTVPGRSFASRVCASLVRAAGVPELVCDSRVAYVAAAIRLGHDRERLAAYRTQLLGARETSLLFDTPRFVRGMEGLFRQMWRAFLAGALPRPDLTNLDRYLTAGVALDGDPTAAADVDAAYRAALGRQHAYAPLPMDRRLWGVPGHATAEAA